MKEYGDCVYCKGLIVERYDHLDYRYHGQLFIVERVPVGVCSQCGEKFLSSDVSKKLEAAVSKSTHPVKTVAIPVISIAA